MRPPLHPISLEGSMHGHSTALFLTSCAVAVAAGAVLAGCADGVLAAPSTPSFTTGNPINTGSKAPYTLAVIGDTPYGPAKFAEFPSLLALINGDPKVDVVVHVGDIKA